MFRKIVENILKETAADFKLSTFMQLPTFKAKVAYCTENLTKLGQGSSRIVYDLENGHVLKIAKNSKGVAQNMDELDYGRANYGIAPELYNADHENYSWIEMEKTYPVKKSEIPSLAGISFKELCNIIFYISWELNGKKGHYPFDSAGAKKIMEEQIYTEKNEFLNNLYNYLSDYSPNVNDYMMINNWGKVIRDGKESLVITDFGLGKNAIKLYNRRS